MQTDSLPPVHPRLDPILYRKCQGDAARLCYTQGWNETNENAIPSGAVFSCLYRHAYRSVEQGRRVSPRNTKPFHKPNPEVLVLV